MYPTPRTHGVSAEPRISPTLALVAAIVAVSTGAILVRWSEAPSSVAAFYRVLFTGLPLLPIALWRYRDDFQRIQTPDLLFATLAGIALALHFATWFESLSWTSVAASVTLVQAQPIFVAIGASLLLRERVTPRMTVGIVIAVVGMVVMSAADFFGGVLVGPRPIYGNALALFAAIMAAGYILAGRSLRQRIALVPYVVIVYGVCTISLLIIVVLEGHAFTGYPAREWVLFIALAVGPGLIGHTVINWALAHIESSIVSVSLLGEPIGASMLAIVLLAEFPTMYTVAGAVVVLTGIFVTAAETDPPSLQPTRRRE